MPFLAFANSQESPDFDKINKIQANCSVIKTQISKLRSNDALKRVNLGQFYESIQSSLMEKMNIRALSNKTNPSKMVEDAFQFSQNFLKFKDFYGKYEKSLTKLSSMDCKKEPGEYLKQLNEVRALRKNLNLTTTELKNIAKKYKESLLEFRGGF